MQSPILLFDGYCNLCNESVKFVLRHEKEPKISFSSIQSKTGAELLKKYHIDSSKTDSLIFIENEKAYIKSSAALRLSKYLKGIFRMGIIFMIIPTFIRDHIYDFVAKNRYKWFGKSDTCFLPDEKTSKRFLN